MLICPCAGVPHGYHIQCLNRPVDAPAVLDAWVCPKCAAAGNEAPPIIQKLMEDLKVEFTAVVKDNAAFKIGNIVGDDLVASRAIKHVLRLDGRGGKEGKEPLVTTLLRFVENFCSERELQTAFKSDCSSSVNSIRDNIKARLFESIEKQLLSSFRNRPSRSQQNDVEYMKEYMEEVVQLETLFNEFWAMSQRDETFDIAFEVCSQARALPSDVNPNSEFSRLVGAANVLR